MQLIAILAIVPVKLAEGHLDHPMITLLRKATFAEKLL
jgi:hypothetical protein